MEPHRDRLRRLSRADLNELADAEGYRGPNGGTAAGLRTREAVIRVIIDLRRGKPRGRARGREEAVVAAGAATVVKRRRVGGGRGRGASCGAPAGVARARDQPAYVPPAARPHIDLRRHLGSAPPCGAPDIASPRRFEVCDVPGDGHCLLARYPNDVERWFLLTRAWPALRGGSLSVVSLRRPTRTPDAASPIGDRCVTPTQAGGSWLSHGTVMVI
eukprot:COSAG02_NODE_4918_length_4836_cov_122.848427_1_plen_216_part_00